MIRIVVQGCLGNMGKEMTKEIERQSDMSIVAGIDTKRETADFPVYSDLKEVKEEFDVIVDFSTPKSAMELLEHIKQNPKPVVLATTGFEKEDLKKIEELAEQIPIFMSVNMSYEITLMCKMIQYMAINLTNCDVEIVETHHQDKKDVPSGTAMLLADCINKVRNNKMQYQLNRADNKQVRQKNEIGISSIRGGNIVGEHCVKFLGEDEMIEVKHTSYSRSIYAKGAINAIRFILVQDSGLFGMQDLC